LTTAAEFIAAPEKKRKEGGPGMQDLLKKKLKKTLKVLFQVTEKL
jgi:hypothetical protein